MIVKFELTEREKNEIRLAEIYVNQLGSYGTDGHGRLVLIHKLIEYIRSLEAIIESE